MRFLENVCVYVCMYVCECVYVCYKYVYSSKLDRDIKFIFGRYIESILKFCQFYYIADRILLSI